MDVKIIPDFLPKPVFNHLAQIIFAQKFPWNITTRVRRTDKKEENNKVFAMGHMLYDKNLYSGQNVPAEDLQIVQMLMTKHMYYDTFANYYDIIGEPMPQGQFLQIEKPEDLLRIKANFFPNTTEIFEYAHHADFDYPHRGAILSLNTCDGYTTIQETGEKYPSVANTLLMFDSSKHHCSSTTTNAIGRFNININYLLIPTARSI